MLIFRQNPISANLIARKNRERTTPLIDADTLALELHFQTLSRLQPGHFPRSCRHFKKSCNKFAQPDWLTLVAIRSDGRKKSQEKGTLGECRRI